MKCSLSIIVFNDFAFLNVGAAHPEEWCLGFIIQCVSRIRRRKQAG